VTQLSSPHRRADELRARNGAEPTFGDPHASSTAAGARRSALGGPGAVLRASRRVGVVLADEHPLARAGVRHCLERSRSAAFDVGAEVTDVATMLAMVDRHRPDLLVVDPAMDGRYAIEAVTHAVKLRAGLAVVVLTSCGEPWLVRDAIAAGARAYVLKDVALGELLAAVSLALRGALYLAPGLAAGLPADPDEGQRRALTAREREVLTLLALGHTYPEIARLMSFSERTVKNYRSSAASALGISTRVGLTKWALSHGLVQAATAA
jgi:two-component system response regulator NreC